MIGTAVGLSVWTPPTAFGSSGSGTDTSSQGAAYGKAYGHQRVAVCHNGHTIMIPPPAVPAHLAHGDTLGPC